MSINKDEFHFARYGVVLKPIQQDQIEMVRQWRNTARIRELMLQQEPISKGQQARWFKTMYQDPTQVYFLVYFKSQPIGVASLTAIDTRARECEPGMYIFEETYQGNIIPFSVAFALNDIAFEVLELARLHGKIFQSNQASLRFHKACGYQVTDDAGELIRLTLTPQQYMPARQKLMRFMRFKEQ